MARYAIYLKRAVVGKFFIEAEDRDDAREIVKMVAPSMLMEMQEQKKAINTFEIQDAEGDTTPLGELHFLERTEL